MDKRGEWGSSEERGFRNLKLHQLDVVVQVGNNTSVVGNDPSDVDEKCGGRLVGGGTCGDEGQEPCSVDEVKCDGERKMAVL